MMKKNRLFCLCLIALLAPVLNVRYVLGVTLPTTGVMTAQNGDDLPTPIQIQNDARQITVRISSATNGGSGVLVGQKGQTYLVLTNRHVAGRDLQFRITTPDGQQHNAQLMPNTDINPKYDVVLLQFKSSNKYQLAKFKYPDGDSVSPLTIGRNTYSAGYPFDSKQIRFTTAQVTELSDVPLDNGTQIGFKVNEGQKELRQGMSGGPILDASGLVIGINAVGANPVLPDYTYFDGSKPSRAKVAKYAQANWGVPIYSFLTQLDANILYNYDNFPKVQRQVTPEGYMARLNQSARQRTVRIESKDGNGSGVIVAKEGNTYYVLTAKHVVLNKNKKDKEEKNRIDENVKVIAHDQEQHEIQPSSIKIAEGLDLAVVKFTSQVAYPVAEIGNYNPRDQADVFVGGYPGRDKIDSPLWQWQLNPGNINDKEQGKFQAQDKQSFTNGYDLIYSSVTHGGMSGGPVFDTLGRVVGIHGSAEAIGEITLGKSLGISIQTFLGVSDKLAVPNMTNILKAKSKQPPALSREERKTVVAVRDNVAKPQAESSGEQWLQYGNQLYRIEQYVEAVAAFERAIAKGREYELRGNYGKALALLGINYLKAEMAIGLAIKLVPLNNQKKYYYLWKFQSTIYRNLGKYDKALTAINFAIDLETEDPILLNEKAIIFSDTKQYLKMIAIYDELIKKRPEAYAFNNRGNAKSDLGQKKEAILDYDQAIIINPNHANAFNNRGNAKSDLGQKKEAILDYDQAIIINPNFAEAYYNRGNAKYGLGQKKEAILDYDQAIIINPNFANAYNNRGAAKDGLGQKKEAILDYDQAIIINPNFANAYNNRGNAKSDLGQKKEAILDYDQAIIINPKNANAYNNRGIAKYDLGQKKEAILDYDQAIIINPKNANAYNNRGIAKYDLGQKKEAILDYDQAIIINRNYAEAYSNRGAAKYDLGQKKEAILDYDQAIIINPKNANAYYNRGNAKSYLGQKKEAIGDYTKAAQLFRANNQMDLYEKAIERIREIQGQ